MYSLVIWAVFERSQGPERMPGFGVDSPLRAHSSLTRCDFDRLLQCFVSPLSNARDRDANRIVGLIAKKMMLRAILMSCPGFRAHQPKLA